MAAPQYKVARACLDVTAGVGIVAILIGAIVITRCYAVSGPWTLYGAGTLAIINGFVVIAAAQLGYAMIDTAISTREMADVLKRQATTLPREARTEPSLDRPTQIGLRAER